MRGQTIKTLTIGDAGVSVPEGAKTVYMYVPALNAGVHTPAYSLDGGSTWVAFALEELINQVAMPTAAGNTGAARWGFQLPYAGATHKVRVTSGAAQTAAITCVFCS